MTGEVWDWYIAGIGPTEIRRKLIAAGFKNPPIPQSISLWLKRLKKRHYDKTSKIVQRRIDKTLPEDLKAAEEIELTSLLNSRQEIEHKALELGANQKFVQHFQEQWVEKLLELKD
ncbi:unnamed protein product, partial [marine sediment metagenome]